MENPYYRAVLAHIDSYFNGKALLTATEIAQYLGCDVRTVRKYYGVTKQGIHASKLAMLLSKQ